MSKSVEDLNLVSESRGFVAEDLGERRSETGVAIRTTLDQLRMREGISLEHTIVVKVEGETVTARQINNRVPLTDDMARRLLDISRESDTCFCNIPATAIPKLFDESLGGADVITSPVNVLLFSSRGLPGADEYIASQPSEGIWVLGDWLSRHGTAAAALCIDPNMFTTEELRVFARENAGTKGPTIICVSVLSANLIHDVKFISELKAANPSSLIIVGGIGAEALAYIPTKSGNQGITKATDIDLVLSGTGVVELTELVEAVSKGEVHDQATLISAYEEILARLRRSKPQAEIQREIEKSRLFVQGHFIPVHVRDSIHPHSYDEIDGGEQGMSVALVLTDNGCDQGCYFCSTHKRRVFEDVKDMADHVELKANGADAIAFNNNDLSNRPDEMILLCKLMTERGLGGLPKHGKMRADRYLPDLLDAFAEAGFVRVAVGVESFSHELRKKISKGTFTDETIESTLEHMLQVGIRPEINLILFSPHETAESLQTTVKEAIQWADRGAMLLATNGLYAASNSPAVLGLLMRGVVSDKIYFDEVSVPGHTDSLLIPNQWKASAQIEHLRTQVDAEKQNVMKELSGEYGKALPLPIVGYITVAILANNYGMEGFETRDSMMEKIRQYAEQMKDVPYAYI